MLSSIWSDAVRETADSNEAARGHGWRSMGKQSAGIAE